ncbi:MAG TPA: thiamine diphosphokinase, partial [Chloroflexota bacterium]|nr:thiamine diphosphokinase [Chloroflexota bacterium]
MNAVVMLAGGFSSTPAIERAVREADLVVAADGGADHLKALGVAPGLLVGDLDSITGEHRTELEAQGVEIVRHPQDKDATDAELALLATLDRG